MNTTIDEIVALTKRRGFVYPSSEIYGGVGGFWDLGPLGVEFANNIKRLWWKAMVHERDDVVGLDASIIMNPKVWEASGHVKSFTDPLVECKECHARLRADQPDEIAAHEHQNWTEPRQFNLLFRTFIGPVEDSSNLAYLRGETCQGIYVNFPNVVASTRVRIPFGIAQIGKVFRNEVTPGKFLFRLREFEQMELEFFVHPKDGDTWFTYWKEERMRWMLSLGFKKEHLRFRQHETSERAHYAADSWDIEYDFPEWGFKELEGVANRTDYDLKMHKINYIDPVTGETFIPYVVEPSVGVSRLFLALLIDSYVKEDKRVVLKLNPKLAPVKVAVFPLVSNKPELVEKARNIYSNLKKTFVVAWDDRGNIGKRYLSQDEVGTPWCVTLDYATLEDDTVTVRDRDTTKQERVPVENLQAYFQEKL